MISNDFYRVMQIIARSYPSAPLCELKKDLKLVMIQLPAFEDMSSEYYTWKDVKDCITDINVNRYLSQARCVRVETLNYAGYGILQEDTRNQELNVFGHIGLEPLVYMKPFDEVWEAQLALLDKLEVGF